MKQLSPLAVAALGMLAERPMHPYEISFHMRHRHLHEHIKLNFGSLYHTFDQLEKAGFVEPVETERDGRRPERTVYRLTPAGRGEFTEHVRRLLLEPAPVYSLFEAGLAFMHHLDRGEAAGLLRQRADKLEHDRLVRADCMAGLRDRGLSRLCLVEVELVQEIRRCEIDWCRQIAAEIESGELEWYAGILQDPRRPLKKEDFAVV